MLAIRDMEAKPHCGWVYYIVNTYSVVNVFITNVQNNMKIFVKQSSAIQLNNTFLQWPLEPNLLCLGSHQLSIRKICIQAAVIGSCLDTLLQYFRIMLVMGVSVLSGELVYSLTHKKNRLFRLLCCSSNFCFLNKVQPKMYLNSCVKWITYLQTFDIIIFTWFITFTMETMYYINEY